MTKQEYELKLKNKLNDKYKDIAKRLETEPNIILRYELKLSLELVLQIYKELFEEE